MTAGDKPAVVETPNYITPAGYKRLIDEHTKLHTVERPKVTQEVSDAAAQGDRSENAEYIYGKKKLREIDRRLRWLGKRIDAAVVVNPAERKGTEKVFFGATVVLEDDDGEELTYQLVGVDEIDVHKGRISWRSPIGSALLGKSVDDEVKVVTPAKTRRLTVVEVRYD